MQNQISTGRQRRWLRFFDFLWWLNVWGSSRPSTTFLIKCSFYLLMRRSCILTFSGTVRYSHTLSPLVICSLFPVRWKSFATFIEFALLSSLLSSIRWLRWCWSLPSWLVSRSRCGTHNASFRAQFLSRRDVEPSTSWRQVLGSKNVWQG